MSSKRSKAKILNHIFHLFTNWGGQNDIQGVSITHIASIQPLEAFLQ